MINEIRKIGVFIKRDFRVMFTYKLAFSMIFFSMLLNFVSMVLFGSMFKEGTVPALATYGGDFISYILIGSIGWGFMWSVASSTSVSLRTEMEIGTIESILLTPTSIYTMILAYTAFGALFGFLSILVLLVAGYGIFGVSTFAAISIFTVIIFILTTIMMMGFAMILGGLTFWIKNIGETTPFIQGVAMLFSGTYFPIIILPESLQALAKCLPFYWSIEGLRLSLNPDIQASELMNYVLILTIFTILFVAIGAYALRRGLIKARKDGSLAYY